MLFCGCAVVRLCGFAVVRFCSCEVVSEPRKLRGRLRGDPLTKLRLSGQARPERRGGFKNIISRGLGEHIPYHAKLRVLTPCYAV